MPKKLSKALTPLEAKNAKADRHADGEGLLGLELRQDNDLFPYCDRKA
jgi:hypothetical protein